MMKTLQQIKDEVAQEDGYNDWNCFLLDIGFMCEDAMYAITDPVNKLTDRVAGRYAEQALDEAATNKITYTNNLQAIGGVGIHAIREFYQKNVLSLKNELK